MDGIIDPVHFGRAFPLMTAHQLPEGLYPFIDERLPLSNIVMIEAPADLEGVNRLTKLTPDWSGPLGADKDQAADLTAGRGLRSSNCCGLR